MTCSPVPLALLLAALATGQAFATQVPDNSIHVTHYDIAIRPDFATRKLKVLARIVAP